MAKSVFTGWRTVTPGTCSQCGFDNEWSCNGRGTVYCACQVCVDCGEFDGHRSGCNYIREYHREYDDEGPTSQPEDPRGDRDFEGGF